MNAIIVARLPSRRIFRSRLEAILADPSCADHARRRPSHDLSGAFAPRGRPGSPAAACASRSCIVLGLSLGASALYSLVAFVHDLVDLVVSVRRSALGSDGEPSTVAVRAGDLRPRLPAARDRLRARAGRPRRSTCSGCRALRTFAPDRARRARPGSTRRRSALVPSSASPASASTCVGRALGITVDLQTAGCDQYWWTIPVLCCRPCAPALTRRSSSSATCSPGCATWAGASGRSSSRRALLRGTLPPLSGRRRVRRQRGDGPRLRLALHPLGRDAAARDRALRHRRGESSSATLGRAVVPDAVRLSLVPGGAPRSTCVG